MKKKYIVIELVVFILIAVMGIAYLQHILKYRAMGGGGGFENFYATEDGTIDVMVYGSSHASCTVNNGMLWDDAGISSFTLSSGSQSIDSTYYFIRESLKTQKPRVILLETLQVPGQELSDDGKTYNVDIANVYRSDLSMKWSPLYVEFVQNQAKLYGFDDNFRNELLLKMPIIHDRYKELSYSDFHNDYYFKRGYGGGYEVQPSEQPKLTDDRKELSPLGEEYLQKIIDLCKAQGIELILFCAPYPETIDACAQQNTISDIAAQNGVTFFDFNRLWQDIGIDFDTDLRDGNHLNNDGADKVTAYLEKYILDNYSLTNHTGDIDYAVWDTNSRYLDDRDDFEMFHKSDDINEYLINLSGVKDKYDIIISLDGNYNAQGEEAYSSSLEAMGIDAKSYEQGGCFVLNSGEFTYYSGSKESFSYTGVFGNKTFAVDRGKSVIASKQENDDETGDTETATAESPDTGIYIGETDYAVVKNGINIVVYDPEINMVVDSMGVDVYKGLVPERFDWFDL